MRMRGRRLWTAVKAARRITALGSGPDGLTKVRPNLPITPNSELIWTPDDSEIGELHPQSGDALALSPQSKVPDL
jgi:hypothetical protein